MDKTALSLQIDKIIEKYDNPKERLIQILLDLQKSSVQNYLSEECLSLLSEKLGMLQSHIYEVATFYSMFNHKPKGNYIIEICKSAPCYVRGSKMITEKFEEILGIKVGETTPDGLFTLHHTSCFGACDVSPAIKIEEKVYGNLTDERIEEIVRILKYIGGRDNGEDNKIDF